MLELLEGQESTDSDIPRSASPPARARPDMIHRKKMSAQAETG